MTTVLFDWYLKHQPELVKHYDGKYIVITNDGVCGAYDNEDEGFADACRKFGLGNFIMQLCTEGDEAYTIQMYSQNVIFA